MPVQNLSYNNIIDRLKAFADGHHMIAAFQHGNLDLIDLPHDQQYPVMHVVPGVVEIKKGQRIFKCDIVFYDLPRAQENENEYQREVLSDCIRLAEDLIYELTNGNVLFGSMVTVEVDNTIQTFTEAFSQVVSGVTLSDITIITPNDWNACEIPATYSPGGSSSTGTGSGTGGIILKTNGTNNAVQNVLDLVQGTNIVIEDLGDGRVRIRATGGGGGGVDWGAIGGDITDQTDLITLIGGYATDAELTAEATTRANADTALQGDIDAVAADLVTETTARLAGDATNATDISNVNNSLTSHTGNTSNPHNTTKAQVGLGNVDNTSDANKPISTATQTALDAKENTITAGTTAQYFRGDKTFQTLDKTAVGLGNVDNTSDANKPVSTAQAAAIALKQDTLVSGTNIKTVNGQSLVGSGNVAVNQSFRTLSIGFTVAGSSGDRFYTMQTGANSGTETNVTMSAEYAMTITEIRIRTTGTQPASGSLVFTLRRNGADTTLVLTLAASSVAGVYTATGSIAIAAGDLICMKIRNNATATSANLAQMSISYT